MKNLGFGLMRLPLISKNSTDIDMAQFCDMVDIFLEHGFMINLALRKIWQRRMHHMAREIDVDSRAVVNQCHLL